MPHRTSDDARNVLFNDMNQPFQDYDLGAMVSWAELIQLRTGVNAALESARAEKKLGKSLEAHVVLVKDPDYRTDMLQHLQAKFADQWADLFIVSDVEVSEDSALYAQAAETPIAGDSGGEGAEVRTLLEAVSQRRKRRGASYPLPSVRGCGGEAAAVLRVTEGCFTALSQDDILGMR